MGDAAQLLGAPHAAPGELGAQVLHRVIADGEPHPPVVERELLERPELGSPTSSSSSMASPSKSPPSRGARARHSASRRAGTITVERAGLGERLDVALLEVRAAHQIASDANGASRARRHDGGRRGLAQAADLPQPEAQRRRRGPRLQRAVPGARDDAWRAHLDAVALRVLDDRRRAVEAHRLRVEQRAGELGRVVHLDRRRRVDEQREARGVRLGEAVLAEAVDLLVELLAERARCRGARSLRGAFAVALEAASCRLRRGSGSSRSRRLRNRQPSDIGGDRDRIELAGPRRHDTFAGPTAGPHGRLLPGVT